MESWLGIFGVESPFVMTREPPHDHSLPVQGQPFLLISSGVQKKHSPPPLPSPREACDVVFISSVKFVVDVVDSRRLYLTFP